MMAVVIVVFQIRNMYCGKNKNNWFAIFVEYGHWLVLFKLKFYLHIRYWFHGSFINLIKNSKALFEIVKISKRFRFSYVIMSKKKILFSLNLQMMDVAKSETFRYSIILK